MQQIWHSLELNQIFNQLSSSIAGLNTTQVSLRLKKYGLNEIEKKERKNYFIIFLTQFKNPLIYILILSAFITYLLKHSMDTWVILAIVFLNASFGFFYEIKAEKAMKALKNIVALKTKVRREN